MRDPGLLYEYYVIFTPSLRFTVKFHSKLGEKITTRTRGKCGLGVIGAYHGLNLAWAQNGSGIPLYDSSESLPTFLTRPE
jgi:hypothetical protein